MSDRGRIRMKATLPSTVRALAIVRRRLARDTPPDDLESIELGLAEVLTNITKHAFDPGDPGRVNVHWTFTAHRVDLQVTDCGRPIPSELLAAAEQLPPDFGDTDLADLPESGFGLGLLMRVFDSVEYRSRANVNRLHLTRLLR